MKSMICESSESVGSWKVKVDVWKNVDLTRLKDVRDKRGESWG